MAGPAAYRRDLGSFTPLAAREGLRASTTYKILYRHAPQQTRARGHNCDRIKVYIPGSAHLVGAAKQHDWVFAIPAELLHRALGLPGEAKHELGFGQSGLGSRGKKLPLSRRGLIN